MRVERLEPGRPVPAGLLGAVIVRDVELAGGRWAKGRRLSEADLDALAAAALGTPVTVLVPDPCDLHEDEAAMRLAHAAAGGDPAAANLTARGPAQSRVDLLATAAGVADVRVPALERLNRIDPMEVFTLVSGQVVAPGDLVASAKVGPHVVAEAVLAGAERVARRGGPIVRVRPFRPTRIAALVKEGVSAPDRTRFEASLAARVSGLGATLTGITHVADDPVAVAAALASLAGGHGRVGIVLTAGGAATDPSDSFFAALASLGGQVVRRGAPAHPGSMLWLARLGRVAVVGLPSCGAYSHATAVDLLLPLLVAGFPPTAATVARLGHGGILDRSQRYRFPAYARGLEAPRG